MFQVIKYDKSREESTITPIVHNLLVIKEDFEGSTEEDLIIYLKLIDARIEGSKISGRYFMGKGILSYYKKRYGKNELQRIATKTGIGISTLEKACQFARKFSEEQIKKLCSGAFVLSWRNIAQNLTLDSDKLIRTYLDSDNLVQFRNAVMKLKNSVERRGKVKKKKVLRKKSQSQIEVRWKKERENLSITIEELKEELKIKNKCIQEHESNSMIKKLMKKNKELTEENIGLKIENERLIKENIKKDKEKKEYQKLRVI